MLIETVAAGRVGCCESHRSALLGAALCNLEPGADDMRARRVLSNFLFVGPSRRTTRRAGPSPSASCRSRNTSAASSPPRWAPRRRCSPSAAPRAASARVLPRPPPSRTRRFVNDMPQIVQPAGIARLAVLHPFLAALPALPRPRRKSQHLDLDRAAFQRRARISPHIAATVMGRPRIEPELSISSVTHVSRNSVSSSRL